MKKIILIFIVLLLFTLPCYAQTNEELISGFFSELEDFENSLPDSIKKALPEGFFKGDFSSLSESSASGIFDSILDSISMYLPSVIQSFCYLLVLILISAIFNTIKTSFESEALKNSFSLASALCISLSAFNIVLSISKYAENYMKILCNIINSFIPLMTAMYVSSGNVTTASISSGFLLAFISIVENFVIAFLIPVIKVCLVFGIITSINSSVDLSGISKTIKNFFVSACGVCMTVFSFVFSLQHTLAQSADTLSLRTAKFAVGNFIPVVGGATAEAMKTVFSSISFLKSSCGVLVIVCVAILTIPVILSVYLNKLAFDICAGISNAISGEGETKIFKEASTICGFILALVFLTALMFIFALTIFLKSKVGDI